MVEIHPSICRQPWRLDGTWKKPWLVNTCGKNNKWRGRGGGGGVTSRLRKPWWNTDGRFIVKNVTNEFSDKYFQVDTGYWRTTIKLRLYIYTQKFFPRVLRPTQRSLGTNGKNKSEMSLVLVHSTEVGSLTPFVDIPLSHWEDETELLWWAYLKQFLDEDFSRWNRKTRRFTPSTPWHNARRVYGYTQKVKLKFCYCFPFRQLTWVKEDICVKASWRLFVSGDFRMPMVEKPGLTCRGGSQEKERDQHESLHGGDSEGSASALVLNPAAVGSRGNGVTAASDSQKRLSEPVTRPALPK